MVFPVMFSIIFFNEQITTTKYIGIFCAIFAVVLTVYRTDIGKTNLIFFLLPVAIFIGSGISDSLVKYVQTVKINETGTAVFSSFVFLDAFIISLIMKLLKKESVFIQIHFPTLVLGILLGLVNFGSLYFLMEALDKSNLDSSVVFAMVNMSIVLLSAVFGMVFFKEKLLKINLAGIFLALVSIYFLL